MKQAPVPQNLDELIARYSRELMQTHQQRSLPDSSSSTPSAPAHTPPIRQVVAADITPPSSLHKEPSASRTNPVEEAHLSIDQLLDEQFPIPEPYPPARTTAASLDQSPPKAAEAALDTEDTLSPQGDLPPSPPAEAPSAADHAVPSEGGPALPSMPMGIGYLQVQATTAREAQPIPDAHITVTRILPEGEELYISTTTNQDGLTDTFPLPAANRERSQRPGIPDPYTNYNIQASAPGFFRVRNVNVPLYGGITALQPIQMIPIPEYDTSPEDLTFFQTGPQNL